MPKRLFIAALTLAGIHFALLSGSIVIAFGATMERFDDSSREESIIVCSPNIITFLNAICNQTPLRLLDRGGAFVFTSGNAIHISSVMRRTLRFSGPVKPGLPFWGC
ncbi:hypothetical protein SAMN02745216_01047 [Desulfatibacillum alkenivorans DSM 16219]|jgi:hypothetical protein|uniref:Uncharacterized protein n=1 Tax=Desulfatibacillum alkenivorans DSM 16219 TaxID=1121393 RepID=A0A1M6GM37_9BACT|nr:hypothetical protein SAMN02745216_01047 [Desulfatibacillum alkenivorans DSM 16219]